MRLSINTLCILLLSLIACVLAKATPQCPTPASHTFTAPRPLEQSSISSPTTSMMEDILSHPIDYHTSDDTVTAIPHSKAVLSGEGIERGILVALALGALLKKTMDGGWI